MKTVFKADGSSLSVEILKDKNVSRFIDTHSSALNDSFAQVPMSDTMRRALQSSTAYFSGMKTFHELNEAFPSLIDENGNKKSFERFLNDVRAIHSTYNERYLRAEYNFAHASAQGASAWEQIQKDGDNYNLQYRTAQDSRVRPDHAALNGVTLPPSDSFWDQFYPPNGWNCRCRVVQVRKSKYPETDKSEAIARGNEALANDTKRIFRFNPGKERQIFPDYNPYTISRCRDCDIAKGKTALSKFIPASDVCLACKFISQCAQLQSEVINYGKGIIEISHLVNRDDNDYARLIQVGEFFAKDGAHVTLTPKMTRPAKFEYDCVYGSLKDTIFYGKCPDLKIGEYWYEHEGFSSDNAKNAFRNMLNHGLKQSDRLIIDRPNLTESYMKRIVQKRVKDGQFITEIWLKDGDKLSLLYKKSEE